MLNLLRFFQNFSCEYWILFQNMHIKALITHPAPLILIHCKSANTHGRGSAVTGPWEMQTFRTSLETVTVV